MTCAEYKRLIAAARKAAADEDEIRWMVRLKALGAVELKVSREAPRRAPPGPRLEATECHPSAARYRTADLRCYRKP
jgi:hypothetical protein